MSIEFRPLSEQNCSDVAGIDSECLGEEGWSEALYRQELSSDKIYSVAYLGDEVVGFGGFAHVFNEGHIMNIAVKESFRRRGIATGILDDLINKGTKLGIDSFTLEVRDGNKAAIALYEKKGFALAGIRKKYYGGKEDARIYWLYL